MAAIATLRGRAGFQGTRNPRPARLSERPETRAQQGAKRRNPRPTRLSGHISPKNGVGDRLFGTAGATAVWGVTESLGKGGGNFC